MKLSNYLDILKKIYEEHGDLDLFISRDEEGNGFYKQNFSPEMRYLRNEDKEEYIVEHIYEYEEFEYAELTESDVEKVVLL